MFSCYRYSAFSLLLLLFIWWNTWFISKTLVLSYTWLHVQVYKSLFSAWPNTSPNTGAPSTCIRDAISGGLGGWFRKLYFSHRRRSNEAWGKETRIEKRKSNTLLDGGGSLSRLWRQPSKSTRKTHTGGLMRNKMNSRYCNLQDNSIKLPTTT